MNGGPTLNQHCSNLLGILPNHRSTKHKRRYQKHPQRWFNIKPAFSQRFVYPYNHSETLNMQHRFKPSGHKTFNQCWFNVDPHLRVGLPLNQHWFNVLCLLGRFSFVVDPRLQQTLEHPSLHPVVIILLLVLLHLTFSISPFFLHHCCWQQAITLSLWRFL